MEEEKSKSKLWLIVVIVLVLLCCMVAACGGVGWYLYQNGDEIFGLTNILPALTSVF